MADEAAGTSAGSISDEQFRMLMDEIKKNREDVNQRLDKLEGDVASGQENAAQIVVQKLKADRSYTFRKKGHEEQYRFNASIEGQFTKAQVEAAKIQPATEREQKSLDVLKNQLKEGIQAIAYRQKRIKVADRSEYGWAVVKAYDSDELASDSEDEKRLFKAEKAAEREMAKRKRRPNKGRDSITPSQASVSQPTRAASMNSVAFDGGQSSGSSSQPTNQWSQGTVRKIGPCFRCAAWGHLQKNCPKVAKYPFDWVDSDSTTVTAKVERHVVGEQSKNLEVSVTPPQGACSQTIPDTDQCFDPWEADCLPLCDPAVGRCWEADENSLKHSSKQVFDVQGRLKAASKFWEETLHVKPPVMEWIREGYKLPLLSLPPESYQANHRSALENSEYVSETIQDLLKYRCIQVVVARPHICSPLSVVINDVGKKRLVLNLRYLNQYLWKDHFKYEDLRTLMQMFSRNDYMVTFDLKSGYHHVDIFQDHWQYLGFTWGVGSKLRYFTFTVLPFGLATACYAFTKLMRPLIKHWRGQGIRAIVYIDDGIVAVEGEVKAQHVSKMVQRDLEKAGLITNIEKCNWIPSKVTTWLGFDINLDEGKLTVPERKIVSLQCQLNKIVTQKFIPARQLASIIGKIIAMSLALGPIARFMTRGLYGALNNRQSWCQLVEITSEALLELKFWLYNFAKYNGQSIWHSASTMRLVYSDASATGYGGYIVEHGPQIAHGQWSKEEARQSSTWRELCGVLRVLESLAAKLRNERLKWFSDNQNVVRILTTGSRRPQLHALALNIFTICVANQIRLEPEWIPRSENEQADFISRIEDYDDWMLDPKEFASIDNLWGPHTIDRFADVYNRQTDRFNSRFWNPESEAVDAFTCDWGNDINWLCPPVYLINRVVQHARKTSAQGTLIVPCWQSAPFWPVLFPDGSIPAQFIQKMRELPQREGLFVPQRSGAVLFKGVPNTKVLALYIKFSS